MEIFAIISVYTMVDALWDRNQKIVIAHWETTSFNVQNGGHGICPEHHRGGKYIPHDNLPSTDLSEVKKVSMAAEAVLHV